MKIIGFVLVWLGFQFSVSASTLKTQSFIGPKGQEMTLASLGEGPYLVVNIATRCGFTPQLKKLEELNQRYQARGLRVLGIPTNDFLEQTPENDQEVVEFCKLNYGVTFPVGKKVTLQGDQASSFMTALVQQSPESTEAIGSNFEKFLISKDGSTIKRFKTRVDPMDKTIIEAIEGFLD